METLYSGNVHPAQVIDKLEEEVQAKQHVADEILANEIKSLDDYIRELEQLDNLQSQKSQSDYLNRLQESIRSLTQVINQELERQMLAEPNQDDQLAVFRQNVFNRFFRSFNQNINRNPSHTIHRRL